jgi:sugar phosphate isomerase/epimerase
VSALRLAYNTNGLQSHRLEDALALLADAGYDGAAVTLDVMHLDPLRATTSEVAGVKRLLRQLRLACVIETGARFVLDPRRKHHPPLDDPDPLARLRRIDHLRRCLEVGAELGAEALTLATGPAPRGDADALRALRVEGLRELLARGQELGVPVSLEPEPGHGVDTLAGWRALREDLPELRLTLDVSHVSLVEPEGTPAEAIAAHAAWLAVVHLEDAPRGVHEHVPFGEGDLDLRATVGALAASGFRGLCAVELSRHSHRGHELPLESLRALRAAGA